MFLSEGTVAPYRYRRGDSPLVVSMPHVGTFVPHSVGRGFTECAACRCDTDWHLPRLYDFVHAMGATTIVANFSRYVIDVNRPPDGANLYPGRDTPKLCPTDTFDQRALYRDGEPNADQIHARLDAMWWPYHRRLERELARVKGEHGIAGEALEQALLDHHARAAAALFGGLEDEVHRAIEVPRAGELLGCAEQHRSVAVMAAAVVHADMAAGMRQA
jgi:N-formylglutamate amidohydrolase